MDTNNKNYYEVLEIPISSTESDINNGYQRAKNAYTQDSVALYSIMTDEECRMMLEHIEEAYSVLGDPIKREQYDQKKGLNTKELPRQHPSHPFSQNNGQSAYDAKRLESMHRPLSNPLTRPIQKTNLNKIVASKKFTLEYDENSDMDKQIEQTTEFSGEFLRKIREYKKVDMVRMADMTKVSKTYLCNIEDEAVHKLPALVYVRGFVYQYAKCLKLNPELVATSYLYRLKKKKVKSA